VHPRAIVIGLDSTPLELIQRFAKEGALPNLAALMKRGAANRALACIPAWTPTNWATLATGAWPGTHGCANWDDRAPGQATDAKRISTFDSRALSAETIWEAAEREGLTSLVMAYPASSPSRLKKGMVVAPLRAGLVSNAVAHGCEYAAGYESPGAVHISLTPARGWRNLPGATAFEAAIPLAGGHKPDAIEDGHERRRAGKRTAADTLYLLLVQPGGQRKPVAMLCAAKNAARPFAVIKPGQWSQWLILTMAAGRGQRRASVRFELHHADINRPAVSLIRSEMHPVEGFTEPEQLSAELISEVGPYIEHPAMGAISEWAYHPTVYEELGYQVDWQAKAARHLLRTRGWDIFYNHWHFPDNAGHHFLGRADPRSPAYNPAHAKECLDSMREVYQIADRLVGGFMKLAGPNTYFLVVSDHGNAANRFHAHLPRRLAEVGLIASLKEPGPSAGPLLEVDWDRSKAYYLGGAHICVNLRGREPHGTVPSRDYERVQEEIIDALYDWKDPETGERAVALALKKRDAHLIGYWGDRCGDVIFTYNSGFAWVDPGQGRSIGRGTGTANHGPQVPTAAMSLSSNLATFIIAGPRIRRGYRRNENRLGFTRLVDVVPTLCHLLEIEPPRHSQGCVLYDLMIR
jgi:predicted AlkP superfamily phosphohydrolase/phosphomutase